MGWNDLVDTVERSLLQAGAILLIALCLALARQAQAWLSLHLAASQRAELDDIAQKALAWALVELQRHTPRLGTSPVVHTDPALQQHVIDMAIGYLRDHFPDAASRIRGETPSEEVMVERLRGVMTRTLPAVLARHLALTANPPPAPEKVS